MRKILFLDVDGVLNSMQILREATTHHALGDNHLAILKRIIDEIGCEIVLSSTWRCYTDSKRALRIEFQKHKIPLWTGQTPDLCGERWTEIQKWLVDNVETEAMVVIVDDDSDAELLGREPENVKSHFVQTDFKTGLDEQAFEKIINAFKEFSNV